MEGRSQKNNRRASGYRFRDWLSRSFLWRNDLFQGSYKGGQIIRNRIPNPIKINIIIDVD